MGHDGTRRAVDVSDFDPPVQVVDDRFVFDLPETTREIVSRLIDDLGSLLDEAEQGDAPSHIDRLFPPACTGDDDVNDEYHHLMRDELITSKRAAFATVKQAFADDAKPMTEAEMYGCMQSLNSLRLVLGTLLGISDDSDEDQLDDSNEYHIYGFLGYLLEWCVDALSDGLAET